MHVHACVRVFCACVCVFHVSSGACRSQQRTSNLLKLEFQAVHFELLDVGAGSHTLVFPKSSQRS